MRAAIALLFLGFTWFGSISTADSQDGEQTVPQILSTSNDYLELVRRYWPRISRGDVLAMTVSYAAMNNCGNFKEEISAADNVDDLESLLQGKHPNDILFAKGIYYKCKRLVENYGEFPGWNGLRLRAALAGDIPSKIWMAFEYYSNKKQQAREEIPYSPGAFLTDAMAAGHHMVFGMIAETGQHYDILEDKSQTTRIAWWLLSCKYRDDCAEPESMNVMCTFMVPECVGSQNLYDVYRKRAGSEAVYDAAQGLANELYLKVQQARFTELGLKLDW